MGVYERVDLIRGGLLKFERGGLIIGLCDKVYERGCLIRGV